MKKTLISEKGLRKVVNRVVRKKLLKEEIESAKVDQSGKEVEKVDEPEKDVVKNEKATGEVPDISSIGDALKAGGVDNLAKQESNNAQRGVEATVAGGTAAAVTYGVAAYAAMGGPLNPVTYALLPAALGAGLYYVFNADAIVGSKAVEEALDTTLYERVSQAFKQIYDKFRKSKDPEIKKAASFFNPDNCLKKGILSPEEQSAIADEIYNATQGGTLGLGIGTDEDGVKAALKKCKSFLGVSQVSLRHAKKHAGGIIDDGNLLKVFRGEFDTNDFDTYVSSVIESLPFIFIGEKSYSKSEFLTWLDETKEIVDNLPKKIEPEPDPGMGEGEIDNYIKECQRLMNDYCANKDLNYTPIKPDGLWGRKTNRLWLKPYLPHVLENHPEISKVEVQITGMGRWSDISAQLIGNFPGYTPGEKGCYRFCKDALSGNSILGKQKGGKDNPIKYYGLGGSGGGGGKRKKPDPIKKEEDPVIAPININQKEEDNRYKARTDGRLDYRNIVIDIDIAGSRNKNRLEDLPGAVKGDSLEFAYDFLGNFKAGRLNLKSEETFQLDIYPEGKNNEIKVKNAKGTRLFKRVGIRDFAANFKRYFKSIDAAELKKLGVNKDSPIIMKVKMPSGTYSAASKRLHEAMHRRKLIKKLNRSVF